LRGMWEGTPFPAFLLIKKVTKESDKLSKNKGSFRGDFYLIGKISCEIKKHTEDFFSKYPCVFVYVPERIRTAGLPLRREDTTTAYGYLPYLNVSFYVYFPL
jgi:hypothetical protein